jgi:hypothetical protein
LTAFIDFDGTRWTSPAHRTDASGPRSPGFEPAVDGQTVTQTFEITGLGGSWLPAAFSPVRVVDGPAGITIDTETSSLITASATSAGRSYTVESVLPAMTPPACVPLTGPRPAASPNVTSRSR